MPLLDQIWRNFSLISRTVLQQDLFFKALHAACAVLLTTGLLCDCHSVINIMWEGVAQNPKCSQSCNFPKAVLKILQPSQFCQMAGYALENTWSSNLSGRSSPQWQMTSSSINSTGLTAETLLSAGPSQHMQRPFLKEKTREVLKGHMWTVSSR